MRSAVWTFDVVAPPISSGIVIWVRCISAATVRASYSPFNMVFTEKTVSGTFYGSVRPDLDFPVLVDHYMNKRLNIDGLISRTYKLADVRTKGLRLRVRFGRRRLGIVAENNKVCLLFGTSFTIFLTSLMKPMSSIKSDSSKTK